MQGCYSPHNCRPASSGLHRRSSHAVWQGCDGLCWIWHSAHSGTPLFLALTLRRAPWWQLSRRYSAFPAQFTLEHELITKADQNIAVMEVVLVWRTLSCSNNSVTEVPFGTREFSRFLKLLQVPMCLYSKQEDNWAFGLTTPIQDPESLLKVCYVRDIGATSISTR